MSAERATPSVGLILTIAGKTFPKVETADHAQDECRQRQYGGRCYHEAEEEPFDECPSESSGYEHRRPANEVEERNGEENEHWDLVLSTHRYPALKIYIRIILLGASVNRTVVSHGSMS